MFGPDTPLVFDALQMAAVIAAGAVGLTVLAFRLRKPRVIEAEPQDALRHPTELEERVRVLERIATDQSAGLADEIEALRHETGRTEPAAQ